jgi:hypothetical protein
VDGQTIKQHRAVMERVLGRKLLPSEDVHHINGKKYDNRPENLRVMPRQEHRALLMKEVWRNWRERQAA